MIVVLGCFASLPSLSGAQSLDSRLSYSATAFGAASSGSSLPFWLSANQYGTIDPSSPNVGVRVGLRRPFGDHEALTYAFGVDLVGWAAPQSTGSVHQLYGRLRYWKFQATAGRREQMIGRVDTSLSIGGTTWSTNAPPPTKVSLATDGYVAVPRTNRALGVRGYLAHGWLGQDRYVPGALLHEKYLYVRILRPSAPVTIHAGIIHHAIWGGTHPEAGPQRTSLKEWLDVALGSDVLAEYRDEAQSRRSNANHLAAYDWSIDVDAGPIRATMYRQFYHEDVASFNFRNVWDGLWGIGIRRNGASSLVNGLLWEHVRMTRQSALFSEGESRGADSYYNHVHYRSGWTYQGRTLGIPLLTPASRTPGRTSDLPGIGNNIIVAHHVGLQGALGADLSYQLRGTYSRNYGAKRVCATATCESFTDARTPRRDQWSFHLQLRGPLLPDHNLHFRTALALDTGEYFDDRVGATVALSWDSTP